MKIIVIGGTVAPTRLDDRLTLSTAGQYAGSSSPQRAPAGTMTTPMVDTAKA